VPQCLRSRANLLLGLPQHIGRDAVKIALPPHRTWKAALERRVPDDASKEAPFECMDPNMRVGDAFRVDQAAHDDTSTHELMSAGYVVSNHLHYRMPSEPTHSAEQAREFATARSSSSKTRMVRLTGVRNCRITQINPTAIHEPRG
jgi:hypothetical protein